MGRADGHPRLRRRGRRGPAERGGPEQRRGAGPGVAGGAEGARLRPSCRSSSRPRTRPAPSCAQVGQDVQRLERQVESVAAPGPGRRAAAAASAGGAGHRGGLGRPASRRWRRRRLRSIGDQRRAPNTELEQPRVTFERYTGSAPRPRRIIAQPAPGGRHHPLQRPGDDRRRRGPDLRRPSGSTESTCWSWCDWRRAWPRSTPAGPGGARAGPPGGHGGNFQSLFERFEITAAPSSASGARGACPPRGRSSAATGVAGARRRRRRGLRAHLRGAHRPPAVLLQRVAPAGRAPGSSSASERASRAPGEPIAQLRRRLRRGGHRRRAPGPGRHRGQRIGERRSLGPPAGAGWTLFAPRAVGRRPRSRQHGARPCPRPWSAPGPGRPSRPAPAAQTTQTRRAGPRLGVAGGAELQHRGRPRPGAPSTTSSSPWSASCACCSSPPTCSGCRTPWPATAPRWSACAWSGRSWPCSGRRGRHRPRRRGPDPAPAPDRPGPPGAPPAREELGLEEQRRPRIQTLEQQIAAAAGAAAPGPGAPRGAAADLPATRPTRCSSCASAGASAGAGRRRPPRPSSRGCAGGTRRAPRGPGGVPAAGRGSWPTSWFDGWQEWIDANGGDAWKARSPKLTAVVRRGRAAAAGEGRGDLGTALGTVAGRPSGRPSAEVIKREPVIARPGCPRASTRRRQPARVRRPRRARRRVAARGTVPLAAPGRRGDGDADHHQRRRGWPTRPGFQQRLQAAFAELLAAASSSRGGHRPRRPRAGCREQGGTP